MNLAYWDALADRFDDEVLSIADSEINGKRVLLSKMVGAGTASGSFDRDGYCV